MCLSSCRWTGTCGCSSCPQSPGSTWSWPIRGGRPAWPCLSISCTSRSLGSPPCAPPRSAVPLGPSSPRTPTRWLWTRPLQASGPSGGSCQQGVWKSMPAPMPKVGMKKA
eukprot:15446903-Alexandrium_andersonii.AAC.1